MDADAKALVVGAGIAGPAASMALQRAGLEPTIYEEHPQPEDDRGWFLNVASNGLDVLRTLGIDLASRVDAHPMPRMVMWNGKGKRLGVVANGIRLPDGTVSLCVKRGDLQRVLREEAVARGVPIEWARRVIDAEEAGDKVTARFSDGSAERGDLLIGADGLHSVTRRILDPTAPVPFYTGLLSVGGYSRGLGLRPTPNTQHLIFGSKAFFGYLVRDSGEVWWFANVGQREEPTRGELRAISAEEWKRRLVDLFRDDLPGIRRIIAAAYELGANAIYDMPPVPTWHRGRVAIIGDSAHATSPNAGQGVSMALEDALTIARCLRDEARPEAAFAAYVALRRERTERVVAYSRAIGEQKVPGPVGRFFRDLFMPIGLRFFANPAALRWLYGHHIEWDERAAD